MNQKGIVGAIIGMVGSFGGFAFTLTDVEQLTRVSAAVVGLAIGIVTLIRMLRGKN